MAEQPSEETIIKLLEELRSDAAYRRMAVIKTIAEQRVDDERIVKILKTIVTEDMSDAVRGYAQAALYALERGQLPPDAPWSTSSPPPQPVKQLSRNEKTRDFLIGFLGWFLVNGLVWAVITERIGGELGQYSFIFGIFVLPPNLLALVILAFARRWVALGLLVAYAANFALALLAGAFINGVCWFPFYIR